MIGFPLINHNGKGKPFATTTKKTKDCPRKHGRDGGDPGRTVGPLTDTKKTGSTAEQLAVKVHQTPDVR